MGQLAHFKATSSQAATPQQTTRAGLGLLLGMLVLVLEQEKRVLLHMATAQSIVQMLCVPTTLLSMIFLIKFLMSMPMPMPVLSAYACARTSAAGRLSRFCLHRALSSHSTHALLGMERTRWSTRCGSGHHLVLILIS